MKNPNSLVPQLCVSSEFPRLSTRVFGKQEHRVAGDGSECPVHAVNFRWKGQITADHIPHVRNGCQSFVSAASISLNRYVLHTVSFTFVVAEGIPDLHRDYPRGRICPA